MSKSTKKTRSLLTESLIEDSKIKEYVEKEKEKGNLLNVPENIRRKYYTIINSSRKIYNNDSDSDSENEKLKKNIRSITMKTFGNNKIAKKNPTRKGGKTKRKRRSKRIKKKKN